MSFQGRRKESENWLAFLAANNDCLKPLTRLADQVKTCARFDDFLQRGLSDVAGTITTLSSLNDDEWANFRVFVERYSTDWETYFDPLTYVGYYQEADRRSWVPSTLPVDAENLSEPHLAVHFWAHWNMADRAFDHNLLPVVKRLSHVTFRSTNIDSTTSNELIGDDEIVQVPSLTFYNYGAPHHTIVGVRPSSEIEREVRAWSQR